MFRRYGCAIAVALLAAGAGAGCGEGEALSKPDYVSQADAVCKKVQAQAKKETEEMFGDLGPNEEPSEEQLTTFVEDVYKPAMQGQVNDLRDLTPPEADEEAVNGVYKGIEESLAKVEDDPKLLLGADSPFGAATKKAADYGFKDCFM